MKNWFLYVCLLLAGVCICVAWEWGALLGFPLLLYASLMLLNGFFTGGKQRRDAANCEKLFSQGIGADPATATQLSDGALQAQRGQSGLFPDACESEGVRALRAGDVLAGHMDVYQKSASPIRMGSLRFSGTFCKLPPLCPKSAVLRIAMRAYPFAELVAPSPAALDDDAFSYYFVAQAEPPQMLRVLLDEDTRLRLVIWAQNHEKKPSAFVISEESSWAALNGDPDPIQFPKEAAASIRTLQELFPQKTDAMPVDRKEIGAV